MKTMYLTDVDSVECVTTERLEYDMYEIQQCLATLNKAKRSVFKKIILSLYRKAQHLIFSERN